MNKWMICIPRKKLKHRFITHQNLRDSIGPYFSNSSNSVAFGLNQANKYASSQKRTSHVQKREQIGGRGFYERKESGK